MAYRPGVEAIRRLLRDPDLIGGRLVPAMFLDTVQRTAFEALDSGELLVTVLADLERRGEEWPVMLLSMLSVEDHSVSTLTPSAEESAIDELVAQLLRAAAQEALNDINRQIRDGSITAESGLSVIRDVRQRLELLGTPSQLDVEEDLRLWLSSLEIEAD